jgi:hypothetical protein
MIASLERRAILRKTAAYDRQSRARLGSRCAGWRAQKRHEGTRCGVSTELRRRAGDIVLSLRNQHGNASNDGARRYRMLPERLPRHGYPNRGDVTQRHPLRAARGPEASSRPHDCCYRFEKAAFSGLLRNFTGCAFVARSRSLRKADLFVRGSAETICYGAGTDEWSTTPNELTQRVPPGTIGQSRLSAEQVGAPGAGACRRFGRCRSGPKENPLTVHRE